MTETDESLRELCTFINSQPDSNNVNLEMLERASTREDIGITSLGVIVLVANYMEAHGLPQDDFDPEWVTRLDSVDGIASVLREIRRENVDTLTN